MKQKLFYSVSLLLIALFCNADLWAQSDSTKKSPSLKIGIFAQLYLDSIFTSNNNFKYKQGIPRFVLPAIEFIQGAEIALDSLRSGNVNIDAVMYDTKSYSESVADLIRKKKLDKLQLIIGNVKDAEYVDLAEFALQKNIPFISVTYPNNAGITNNPFLVIVNSTLKSHCEAIYSYILQNHGTDKIYLFRQKGAQEDMVAGYFKQLNEREGKPLLQIQTVNFDNDATVDLLKSKLDSNRKNIIIGGSLDENFASNIAHAGNQLYQSYPITLIGMPNWDGFPSLQKKDNFEIFPIFFTSPYFNDKEDGFSKMLIDTYFKKFKIKPSDMAFKGFESVYQYTKLLALSPENFMNNINDKSVKVFCDYNFKPVVLKKDKIIPDYFENKHLYFVKILNGSFSKAW